MLTLKSYRNSKAVLLIMKSGLYLTVLFLICFVTYKLAWSQPYQAANVTSPSIAFNTIQQDDINVHYAYACLLYTSPSPRDKRQSRMPSSA